MFLDFLFTHTPLFYFVQSFWRDEAFSVLFAQMPISVIITKSSIEPPLYYILLHMWMKFFGTGEIATRSLSLVGFLLATIVVIEWANTLFKSHWLSKFMPFFFFLNPMLLYYAFEVRAYGWYIFFTVLSMYAYDLKKWRLYTIAVILGIYTHLYLGIIPLVHCIHYVYTHSLAGLLKQPKKIFHDPLIQSLGVIGIWIIPLLLRLVSEITKFKQSWYYPIDLRLILSVLGNMFVGYEGTPWYLWIWTDILSMLLLVCFLLAILPKKTRAQTIPLFLMIIIPLSIVISISFIKPLFTNRYFIPVTVAEILLLSYTIFSIPRKGIQKIIAGVFLIAVICFDGWYPTQHAKLDIRKTIREINSIASPKDLIVASDSLVFLETLYYAQNKANVRLYNPFNNEFPWYVGGAVYSPKYQLTTLPFYPVKAFFIETSGAYTIRYTTIH